MALVVHQAWVIFSGMFDDGPRPARTCIEKEKQLILGMLMYSQDYDDRLPAAGEWSDAIFPFLQNEDLYRCPQLPDERCGYCMNSALERLKIRALPEEQPRAEIVALFDGPGGWNRAGGIGLVRYRHREERILHEAVGTNVGFLDGHCKWLSPESAADATWHIPDVDQDRSQL
jgi:prepilin-type processing-associated H-X9-DG protein